MKKDTATLGTDDSFDRGENRRSAVVEEDHMSSNTRFRRHDGGYDGVKRLTPVDTNTTEGFNSRNGSKMEMKKEKSILERSNDLIKIGKNIMKSGSNLGDSQNRKPSRISLRRITEDEGTRPDIS